MRELRQRFLRIHVRTQLDDRHVLALVVGDGARGAGAGEQHVPARHAEKVGDVLAVLGRLVALPGQVPLEAQLAALADRAHGADIHRANVVARRAPQPFGRLRREAGVPAVVRRRARFAGPVIKHTIAGAEKTSGADSGSRACRQSRPARDHAHRQPERRFARIRPDSPVAQCQAAAIRSSNCGSKMPRRTVGLVTPQNALRDFVGPVANLSRRPADAALNGPNLRPRGPQTLMPPPPFAH